MSENRRWTNDDKTMDDGREIMNYASPIKHHVMEWEKCK